jgi:VWFA-related protein
MTPPRGPVWCIAVAMSAALLSSAARSQNQGAPVFRGGTTFVSVDAYPRRDGKFIDNLSAADFTVLEDGKPQKIDTFELVRFEPNEFDAARVDPNSLADAERQAADPRARLFVVYLDVYHTTFVGSALGSQPVVEFLDRTITRRDLFGVLTPNTPVGALTFARRTETIERELRDHWDWGEKRDTGSFLKEPGEQDIEICKARVIDSRKPVPDPVGLYREDLLMTSLERLTTRLGDLRDERKNVLFLSQGWVPTGPVTVDAFLPPPQRPPIGVGRGGRIGRDPNPNVLTSASHVSTDDECRAKLQRLFDTDFGQRFDDLVTAAARANIAFYPVDVGGLTVAGVRNQSTLRTLAEANDGMSLVNTNDLRGAFRGLSERLSAYYLLGYYSNNETRDGKFRKIDVRVGNQKVSARLGYFAYPLVTPAPAAPSSLAAPVEEALTQLGRLDSDDEVFATAVSRAAGIDVVVELAERPFGTGRWSSGASVEVRLRNAEGTELKFEGWIDPGRRSIMVHVPGATGTEWRARAEVTGGGAPAETSWVRAAVEDGGPLGLPKVYRGMVSARVAVQPAAEMRFNRNERIHLEVPIDDVRAAQRSARVLDRRGQPLPVPAAVGVQSTDGRATMSVDVLAGGLAAGDYLIEVTGGAGAEVQRRLFAFRVVR